MKKKRKNGNIKLRPQPQSRKVRDRRTAIRLKIRQRKIKTEKKDWAIKIEKLERKKLKFCRFFLVEKIFLPKLQLGKVRDKRAAIKTRSVGVKAC